MFLEHFATAGPFRALKLPIVEIQWDTSKLGLLIGR
jgi:hypothetical protein